MLAELQERLNQVNTQDVNDGATTQIEELKAIVDAGLALSSPTESKTFLTELHQKCQDTPFEPQALNALACSEKRLGCNREALAHLERAADLEGGLASANVKTLLNLSATYSAMQMFAEAASIANHALLRCSTDFEQVGPSMKVAALHNLGAALEGSGEWFSAQEAYEEALQLLIAHRAHLKPTATYRTVSRARDQLELRLRNLKAHAQQAEWAESVMPKVSKQAVKVMRKTGELPPLKTPPLLKAPPTQQQQGSPTPYASPVRQYHAVRSLKANLAQLTHSSNTSTELSVPPRHPRLENSKVADREPRLPWNSDPFVSDTSTDRRVVVPKNPELEKHLDDVYVSRFIVPLMEDLRYKESTRRHTITKECKDGFVRIKALMKLHRVGAAEDEDRANLEIEELRVRRVLLHWIKGKLLFAECSSICEKSEMIKRQEIIQEFVQTIAKETPKLGLMNVEGAEEEQRAKLLNQEAVARNELELSRETLAAAENSNSAVRKAKRSLSFALVQWCLESVMDPNDVSQLIPESLRTSLHVLERYVVFGVPRRSGGDAPRHSIVAGPPTPTNSSAGSTTQNTPSKKESKA